MCLAILLEFGTLVTMAEDTELRNDVDPRPVQPLELPAYAWRSVKQYVYRHESWCKVEDYVFFLRAELSLLSLRSGRPSRCV